jgi:RNA recognition motif-containing protein
MFCKLGGEPARRISKKIFVGRLPPEATAEDLRQYFGRFGHILDVYVPRVRISFLFCFLSITVINIT